MIDSAFAMAAAELGMASASWLFVEHVEAAEPTAGVERLRNSLGRRWPILDAVCAAWLEGGRAPAVRLEGLLDRLQGLQRLLFIGLEARWLDVLLPRLPRGLRTGLLRHSELNPDWERVRANLGRVELVELGQFQSWAGSRSALLSFVYGSGSTGPFAPSAWARVLGPDTRTQFRDLIGWEVLGLPLSCFPRWLVASEAGQFSWLGEGCL